MNLFFHFLAVDNIGEATYWLRLAAEQRSCDGMLEYGRLLRGTGKDKAEGDGWLQRAEQSGCSEQVPGAD